MEEGFVFPWFWCISTMDKAALQLGVSFDLGPRACRNPYSQNVLIGLRSTVAKTVDTVVDINVVNLKSI